MASLLDHVDAIAAAQYAKVFPGVAAPATVAGDNGDSMTVSLENPRKEGEEEDSRTTTNIRHNLSQLSRPSLLSYPSTHQGNAEALAAFCETLKYDPARGWFRWNGNIWQPGSEHYVAQELIRLARMKRREARSLGDDAAIGRFQAWARASESRSGVDQSRRSAEDLPGMRHSEWDSSPLLLCVSDGVVRLRDGSLHESQSNLYITRSTGIPYLPDAECPRWIEYLEEVFAGDGEVIDFVQRAVGYTLTGDTSEKLCFFCYGPADSGKSTFLNVLTALLGTYATTKDFETFLLGRANLNATAGLEGIRLAVSGESRAGAVRNDAVLKRLTGGDMIEARHLYRESFTFRPRFKIWVASNDLPTLRDSTGASFSRLAMIPFPRSFPRNGQLAKRLERELPGILAWAVQGAIRWYGGDKLDKLPAASTALLNDYREEQNLIGRYLAERTQPGGPTRATDLYKDFGQWCAELGLRVSWVAKPNAFGRSLAQHGFKSRHTNRGSVYDLEVVDFDVE